MKNRSPAFSRVWLVLLFWFSIIFVIQVLSIFVGDLIDLLAGLSSPDFWTRFFRVFWGLNSILVVSLSSYLSYRQIQSKQLRGPKIDVTGRGGCGLLVLTVVMRLVVAPLFSHAGDTTTILLAGYNIARGNAPYDMSLSSYGGPRIPEIIRGRDQFILGYPPLWGLIASFSYKLSNLLAPDSLVLHIFMLKLLLILSDVLLAYLIFRIVKATQNRDTAMEAALFFLLCPFVVLVGAVWGQIDVLCALFTTLSIYLLIGGHVFASGLVLGLGFATKYYPLVVAPIFFLSLRKMRSRVMFACGLAATVLLVLASPLLLWGATGFTGFLNMFSNLLQDTQTLLTPFYALETMFQVIRKDSWIQAWFWFKENPLVRSFWMLPMIWLYLRHERLVSAKSSDSRPTLQEVLPSSISVLLVFTTFKFWITEQVFLTPLALAILYSYSTETEDSDYLNLLWILLVLSCWFTTRLGHHLLLPVWDLVKGWAFHITYLGDRYMFWMRSLTSSLLGLYIAAFNLTYVYVLQRRMTESANTE